MDAGKPYPPVAEEYWREVFSGLESTGVVGPTSKKQVPPVPRLNAHVDAPLARLIKYPGGRSPETVLPAAWAIVQARHSSTADVIFYSSFPAERPWLAPLRVQVPAAQPLPDFLDSLDNILDRTRAAGSPPDIVPGSMGGAIKQIAPTFLVILPQAASFPPRAQIQGPLLIIARLDLATLEAHYDADWFTADEVHSLVDHLNIVLCGMTAAPEGAIGELPLLTPAERVCLLDDWNDTARPFQEATCVHQFFEEQAARTPEAIAVVFRDEQLTYRELNHRAEQFAQRLRAFAVGPGSRVALCLPRSLDLMVTLLGVLKAGAAYVPLDPSYPAERLSFMIEDANPAVIVATTLSSKLFPFNGSKLILIDQAAGPIGDAPIAGSPQSSDAAYILYTSGSTGKPKGVIITHRNVSNFFTAMDGVIGTDPGVWLAVTSVNFDISVFELFWTLARGFRIILQEEGQWVAQGSMRFSLPEQIRRHGVTHLQCTPSLASLLICDPDSVRALRPLRYFLVGGEPLPLDLAHRLTEIIDGNLINLYGPTETTVWSAAQKISRHEKQILIGRPVANTQLYVLEPSGQLAPIGSVGELLIGGDGLAREYLNRPEVTAERFVHHTLAPGRSPRLYRTGDLVRYQPEGRLEFMGRMDQQIKIRGVRVELGEIEVVLRDHPGVQDAVVLAQEDETHDKRLVAYLIAAAQPPAIPAMQEWLAAKLPKILIPSAFFFLPEFPRTPNGKLDRRAFPSLEDFAPPEITASPPGRRAYHSDTLEGKIAAIWTEVLGVDAIGLDDRFFDLGGKYPQLTRVHAVLLERVDQPVAMLDLLRHPTVRSLARHLKDGALRPKTSAKTTGRDRGRLRLHTATGPKSGRRDPHVAPSS